MHDDVAFLLFEDTKSILAFQYKNKLLLYRQLFTSILSNEKLDLFMLQEPSKNNPFYSTLCLADFLKSLDKLLILKNSFSAFKSIIFIADCLS